MSVFGEEEFFPVDVAPELKERKGGAVVKEAVPLPRLGNPFHRVRRGRRGQGAPDEE